MARKTPNKKQSPTRSKRKTSAKPASSNAPSRSSRSSPRPSDELTDPTDVPSTDDGDEPTEKQKESRSTVDIGDEREHEDHDEDHEDLEDEDGEDGEEDDLDDNNDGDGDVDGDVDDSEIELTDEELEELERELEEDEDDEDEEDGDLDPRASRSPYASRPPRNDDPRGPMPRPPGMRPKAPAFMKYFGSIPRNKRQRLILYVYRLWPVIDRSLSGSTVNYIDKIAGEEWIPGEDWLDDVYRRWGTGDYHLKLNDEQTKKTLVTTNVNTPREFTDYPPILNFDEVVWEDPQNKLYRAKMESRGDLHMHQNEKTRQEAESTNAGLVGLMEKILLRKDRGQDVEDLRTKVLLETVGMSQQMIRDSVLEAQRLTGKKDDPMETVKSIIGLSEAMTRRDSGGGGDAAMMKQMLETARASSDMVVKMMEAQLAAKTTEVSEMRKEMSDMRKFMMEQAATKKDDDILSQFQKMLLMKDTLGELFDTGKGRGGGTDWSQFVPVIDKAITGLSGIAHNIAVARAGGGSPLPPAPGGETQTPPPPPGVGVGVGGSPGPSSSPLQEAGASSNPNLQGIPQEQLQEMYNLSQFLGNPLLNHLQNEELNGVDFAEWFQLTFGRPMYLQAKEAGKESFLLMLQVNEELWGHLVGIPGTLDQFLEEFFHRDEILEQEDREEQGEGEHGAQTPAGQSPPPAGGDQAS